ncbi:hypothetical protein BN59_00363 [Legionella massiliensis]|uniref:Uncharacterized protein n=1 Tax=Legionella massiliensis TaxID=1034943 RepID=A0A078KWH1_9GAMM|nr:hypothetical protein [Legionella massiliensis]CDZ76099.1 hypothetical protein BN59_00363 [Legionella massiliensis]CEE11837.1 hypothetical protein BN1094_00363 [Legionella massiliensis]
MTEYDYKSFKIHYEIHPDKTKKNLYTADGYICCTLDQGVPVLPRQFHTEYITRDGVQKEIRKLIENYIDFEWQEFHDMQGEKISRGD